ncbi:hypothetical protein FH609_010995 [Streptomyces sp. 3MP-14]|uniref:Uncharacterized protein n=1 Tax=Streptomyces mimosae TaxID=2586635 RepID=A0A5N5ZPA2_9ACTN|nr:MULTISPECIES: hypothetical protein [Streptomyces]KAB8158337.1 hypothetical protein FH607_029620 [Streptomyces mimosae]KAB8176872.1 hypothetical protein FH609_010995 [Streptomyces sp. 3MP-14]
MDDRGERRPENTPEQRASPDDPTPGHRVELFERGPFLAARCSCGWYGPARRSRPLARDEAAGHLGRPPEV